MEQPKDWNDTAEHGRLSHELEFALIRALGKQHGTGEGGRSSRSGRPLHPEVVRAAVLRIVDADCVDAGFKLEVLDLRMHIGRRRSADHLLLVDPNVKTVVACAVQLEDTCLW